MGVMLVSRALVGTYFIMLLVLGDEQLVAAFLLCGDETKESYFSLGLAVGMDVVLSVVVLLLLFFVYLLWKNRRKNPHNDTAVQTTVTQLPRKPEEVDDGYLTPVSRVERVTGPYEPLHMAEGGPTSTAMNTYSEISVGGRAK